MVEPTGTEAASGRGRPAGQLLSASFIGLLTTQFLTAVNDNTFRWLVIGIGKRQFDSSFVLMAGSACFLVPYILFAAYAGYFADRFSKRRVILLCKVAEVVIMMLGMLAIWTESIGFLFVIVALMGLQSVMFAPAKSASIPELVTSDRISQANGWFGLTTVVATVVGTASGNLLADGIAVEDPAAVFDRDGLGMASAVVIGTAVVGLFCSLPIARVHPADSQRRFPWNAWSQTGRDLRSLATSRPLLRVALGSMCFWSLGLLAQLNIDQFVAEGRTGDVVQQQSDNVPMLLSLVAGVGAGSIAAGIWSGGHVELGILPLGASGLSLFSMLLFLVSGPLVTPETALTSSYAIACLFLGGLGFSAGLFQVPLAAYLQHRSPRELRGSILAATNFLSFSGMLLMSFAFFGLRYETVSGEPWLSSRQIFLLCGVLTIPILVYIVCLIPQASIRFVVWLASKTVYRIRVYGRESLPERGGALLVSNHVSWLDGVLFLLTSSRPVRLVAWAGNFKSHWMQRIARFWGVILISAGPQATRRALEAARQALLEGELVGIFPEGGLTRSGQIQGFKPGMMKILEGTSAPVIPVYLDQLWGSIFSYERGRLFWKTPRRWPYPISIHFGPSVAKPEEVHEVRRAVQDLGAQAVQDRASQSDAQNLPSEFIRRCKQRRSRTKIADSSGAALSGVSFLMRCLILRRLLRRHVLEDDERYVGLLLPPSVAGVAANLALTFDHRITVNLNYTVSSGVLNACLEMCGIRHVLTSRRFMEKMDFDLNAELIYLEDFREDPTQSATLADKLSAALQAHLVPARMLQRSLGLHKIDTQDVLTIIFTSGSTGTPKGVMLTYGNIAHNVDAIDQVIHLRPEDVLLGILPLFHSLGYTVTMWAAMSLDIMGVYHFSPLDGKQIGKLCEKHKGTLLLTTPTFLRNYLRRCTPEQLKTLDVVVAGAEQLPTQLADTFEQKFGVRPVEGYGATELSPLVSVNVPPSRSLDNFQVDRKEGTVGRPVPGVTAKIVDLESGEELGAGQSGMLWAKGANVMKGYLHRQDLTDEVIVDGWYKTGDVALIDADGFIQITGRESRFSKIGGEMVPHIKVEETLEATLGEDEDGVPRFAVTAVPDAKKGERLVVVHTEGIARTPDELRSALTAAGLPNICIPSAGSFHAVKELPVLGSGKLDLKKVKQIALQVFAEPDIRTPTPDDA